MRTKLVVYAMVCSLAVLAGSGAQGADNTIEASQATPETLLPLAKQGDADSQRRLGVLYAYGKGVPQDDSQALFWIRKAAEQGDARAQRDLGVMYSTGKGVSQSDEEAVKWFRLAASQGNAYAQDNLARMFLLGRGVAQDDKEAARWYRLAADQGNAHAQQQLGLLYAIGRGVPLDLNAAKKWEGLAVAQGDVQAKEILARLMSTYQDASQAMNEGYERHPPPDASSPEAAIAMMHTTTRIADELKNQCISRYPDMQQEIEQMLSNWKSAEAHAIEQSDVRWLALIHAHPELATIETAGIGLSTQAFMNQFKAPGNELIGPILCKKYFSDLESGAWRKRTPKMYGFLDQMH
jgi:TPR repeat protein